MPAVLFLKVTLEEQRFSQVEKYFRALRVYSDDTVISQGHAGSMKELITLVSWK